MKHLTHIVLFIAMMFSHILCFSNNDVQLKAEKLYAKKNYKETITVYESLIKEGFHSSKLYYNLGNAYYKNNEIGKAIYSYELALKLNPNFNDAKNNLQLANKKTIDQIESKENYFVFAIKKGITNSLSTKTWAWISVFSFTFFLLGIYSFIIYKSLTLKRISFFICMISFICFLSSVIIGYLAVNEKNNNNFAIILSRESKIYEEPNTNSKVKFKLHEGTKADILDYTNDWRNIKLENGNEGWVSKTDIGEF
jgi:tetratricopeptide (TPR) repeat protein